MSELKLYFLGTPRIELGDQPVAMDTRKAVAMLAYLTLTGEQQSRDSLAALLWPEYDTSRAKAALRRTLSTVKTAVSPASLTISREAIGLTPGHYWCDVIQFHQHITDGELETAVSLYRDDFLTGFSLRDSIPFDDWQLIQTQTLRRELETVFEALIKHLLKQQAYDQALPLAHRWLALDPLREEVHRYLMQLYAWVGQPNAALRQYRDCVRILEEELGVPPLPETTALYEAIQYDRLTLPPPSGGAAESVLLSPQHSAVPVPLVGRTAELAMMQDVYAQIGENGRFLAIEGETGIGKTRLAELLLSQVKEKDAVVLATRCYAGESHLAYTPLMQLLREGLALPEASARLAHLSPSVLTEVGRLLPELARSQNDPVAIPALHEPGAQSRFFESVGQVLTALLGGTVPGVLWIDDGQWLDAATLDVLLFLARRWQKRPFLIMLAWRSDELPTDHLLHQLVAEMHRDGVGEIIQLSRFTPVEVAELIVKYMPTCPVDFPDRLYAETEGLPFFVVEYLADRVQQPLAEKATWHIPRTVRELLHTRLAQVGEAARQLLQAAAVIGHSFSFDLVQTASGRSEEEAIESLEGLVARGILLEETGTSATLSAGAYDFSHEKLRALAYEEMSLARRRLLHRRLAATLSEQASHVAQPAVLAGEIAGHYQASGQEAEAAVYYKAAGDYARALFAHRDALAHYQMAMALGAGETATSPALSAGVLHEACGDLYTRLGEYATALNSYETAAALASASDLGRIEHKLVQVYLRQGEWLLAEQKLAQAWQSYKDDLESPALSNIETTVAAQLYSDGSLIAHRQNQLERAQELAQKAFALVQNSTDTAILAQTLNILGVLARSQGNLEQAENHLTESLRLADDTHQLDVQIAACNNLALTVSAAGRYQFARQYLEQALTLCQSYGDRHHEAALRNNLADLFHQAGEEDAAMEQLKQAVTIFAEIGQEQGEWQAEIWKLSEW